jgi:hypothetical protein
MNNKDNTTLELAALINDSFSNKVALFNENAAKYTDQAVREAFYEILGDDKLTWRNWRAHKTECFEVMETVLNVNLPLAWNNSSFYEQFVETRNGALGDTNEFVVDNDDILFASRFAGNYWSVNRQKLQGKSAFGLQTEWITIRVYDELERFLKGNVTLAEMITKLQKGFQNEIDSRIFTSFNGIGTYLPAKFQESGSYDKDTMSDLIQRVQVASQKNVILAGTRSALSHIVDGMDAHRMSESQKEELATKGTLLDLTGLGVTAVEIPQTFVRGTYDFKADNKSIFILPDNAKFIKLYFEGDTRARELTEKDNNDMTIDTTVQTKLGVGIVVPTLVGKYTIV